MSVRTLSRHTATYSLSFADSAAMCRESLQKDCISKRSTLPTSKHTWTTLSEKYFTPHTKSTACGPAWVLPICSSGRTGPYASVSKNPRDPAAETCSANRRLPFQRRVGCDPGAANSPHVRGSKSCGLAERTLRHGSACSGVGRSLRRRRAFGSTRADSPSGKGAQNARCAFDGKHSSASTESHAGKQIGRASCRERM